jgi:hypothetical protein
MNGQQSFCFLDLPAEPRINLRRNAAAPLNNIDEQRELDESTLRKTPTSSFLPQGRLRTGQRTYLNASTNMVNPELSISIICSLLTTAIARFRWRSG